MKIFVFGNLGSGKSHLTRYLAERFLEFSLLSIDGFRRQFGDGTIENELLAKHRFIEAIDLGTNQIIEATGCGDTGEQMANQLSSASENVMIVILDTPLEVCLSRLRNRIWDVPYPAPTDHAINLAERTDALIREGEIQSIWSSNPNAVILKMQNITDYDNKNIFNHLKSIMES
jgi:adenylate kinase family enzyme